MRETEYQQLIFGNILLLSNKFSLLGDRVTKKITLKQWLLLNMIFNMQDKLPNYVELANAIGTTRQNVGKMIYLLEKKVWLY